MKIHTYINSLYKPVIALLMVAVLNACIDDEWGRDCIPAGDIQITLTLQLPGTASRATEEQENRIDEIEVLLFKPDDGGFAGNYTAQSIVTPDPAEPQKRNFTVKVIEGKFDIMVLANSKDIIDQAGLGKEMSRREVARRLTLPQNGKVTHDGNIRIPFWGELKGANIVNGSTLGEITLLRAMAKIDILLDEAVKDLFKLQTVTLYHWQKEMALLPDALLYDETNTKVIAATNTGSGLMPQSTTATYTAGTGEIENEEKITSKIYLNETPNPGEADFPVMPCLVVGGEYKGETCYYRVDFSHDLLRNHWYELTVKEIKGNGSSTEEGAYKSVNADLGIEVMEWDESDMSDIIFEGKYFLKVNQSKFELDRESHDENSFSNKLTIETNYEEGWVINRLTEPDDGAPIDMDNGWIHIAPAERSGPKDETTISILLEENNTDAPRSAEIHLQVGRLIDFIVKVTQSVERKLELYIEDLDGNPLEELIFYDFYGNDQPYQQKAFRVRWVPYGTDGQGVPFTCKVTTTLVGDNHFDYKSGIEVITNGTLTDATGMKQYTIEPQPFSNEDVNERAGNPFLQRASLVTFSVSDPADASKTISKTIFLNHQHIAILSRNFRRLSYPGRKYEFNVLANTPWIIEQVVSEDEGFKITDYTPEQTTGGNNITKGTTLTYTTSPEQNKGIGQAGRKAIFYLRDQRGIIPDAVPFTVSAVYEDPNSYIVHPSSSGTTLTIPIRKLFWIREREAGDASVVELLHNVNALQPSIVWQDYYNQAGNNLSDYGVTLRILPGGTNALDYMLEVTIPPAPADGVMGNALVGVKRSGESTMLWSWHIWLTDYDPDPELPIPGSLETEESFFMYRNLGALTGEQVATPHTIGFYYQWGRKDPLRPQDITTKIKQPAVENLVHAINEPDVFFRGGNLSDWYTSSGLAGYQDDFLWTEYDNHKSQYDPCPDGWRVPNLIHTQSTGTSLWRHLQRYQDVTENDYYHGFLMRVRTTQAGSLFLPAGGYYDDQGKLNGYREISTNYNANAYHEDLWPGGLGLHALQGDYGGGEENPIERAAALPVRCIKRTNN